MGEEGDILNLAASAGRAPGAGLGHPHARPRSSGSGLDLGRAARGPEGGFRPARSEAGSGPERGQKAWGRPLGRWRMGDSVEGGVFRGVAGRRGGGCTDRGEWATRPAYGRKGNSRVEARVAQATLAFAGFCCWQGASREAAKSTVHRASEFRWLCHKWSVRGARCMQAAGAHAHIGGGGGCRGAAGRVM